MMVRKKDDFSTSFYILQASMASVDGILSEVRGSTQWVAVLILGFRTPFRSGNPAMWGKEHIVRLSVCPDDNNNQVNDSTSPTYIEWRSELLVELSD